MVEKNLWRRIKSLLRRYLKKPIFPKSDSIIISPDFFFGKYIHVEVSSPKVRIEIKQRVILREFCNLLVRENAELIINENVFFNNSCSINCLDRIVIGENTMFGEGVKLYDHNHKYNVGPSFNIDPHNFNTAPITIGKNCWIGSNVTILKGVEIGENVIIGANNLIYKSIPANKIVKSKSDFTMEDITSK